MCEENSEELRATRRNGPKNGPRLSHRQRCLIPDQFLRSRLKSLIDYFMDAPAAGRLQNEARLRPHTLRSVERAQRRYRDGQPRPFGLRPSRPGTALRRAPRSKARVFAPRRVSDRLGQQRNREIINQRLPVFDRLRDFPCRTGCPNAAEPMDGRERRRTGCPNAAEPMDGRERRRTGCPNAAEPMDGRERPRE